MSYFKVKKNDLNKYENNFKIIEHGVRLFKTVENERGKLTNEIRRQSRSTRRQVKRRRTLKRDFIKFLINNKVVDDIKIAKNNNFVKGVFRKIY